MNIAQRASIKEVQQVSITDEDIRARAYAIWEDEGRPEGKDIDHWRRAIDEVGAPETTTAPSNGVKPPARRATKAKATR